MSGRTTGLLAAGRERQVPLRGRITQQTAAACIARLVVLAVEGPEQPIVMYIDSPGGSVAEALSIISTMNGIKCPVATFCYGAARGAAAIIAAHGTRGFRTASPNSAFSFKIAERPGQIRTEPDTRPFHQIVAEIIAKDARKTEAIVLKWLRDGSEFNAQQAFASGFVDGISSKPMLPPEAGFGSTD